MNPIAAAALPLFFLLALVVSSPVPRIGDCVPRDCGNVTNITYPFWVSGRQPDYCGLPGFMLHCEKDDTPSLQTPDGDYYVRNISYADQSIHVAPSYADCPIYRNLTFTSTPFDVSLTNWELLLIYDCTTKPTLLPDYYPISCGGNESFSRLYYNYSIRERFELPAPCEIDVVPVLGFPGAKPSDYARLINDGFLLNWTAANCSDCKESGGDCGYNTSRETFMCICKDRTHSRSCGRPSNFSRSDLTLRPFGGICADHWEFEDFRDLPLVFGIGRDG